MQKEERANFGSKLGVILATAGSAVGLGNVWRFSYVTGENGGAAFILIYILCVVLMGIPCMMGEFIIGRHGSSNTARAYGVMGGKKWKWVGYLGVLTGFIIIGYYAVVSGWCLEYIVASSMGSLGSTSSEISAYFGMFSGSMIKPVFWTAVILFITHRVIIGGVRGGIERVSKAMMPTLFVLMIVVVVASCTLPSGMEGLKFLFKPDFSKVTAGAFLAALGQAFFSLSIGMGCLCTYASYFSRQTNLLSTAVEIAFIDLAVAILAGLMIFPAAFSVGVNPDSGPSLVFITLPHVFHQAFSTFPYIGMTVAMAFYALLSLAALTSLISMHEVSTAFLSEELKISRKSGAWIVTLSCFITGTLCSLSLGAVPELSLSGKSMFDIFDFVSGQIFLPIGGLFTCIMLGWFAPVKVLREQFTNWGVLPSTLFNVFIFLIRYICPAGITLIFLRQLEIV